MGEEVVRSRNGEPELRAPKGLSRNHDVAPFDCGHAELNEWLIARALSSEGFSARSCVAAAGRRVCGYYCLSAGSAVCTEIPSARLRKNMPGPVPVVVIGRRAVDRKFQNRGLGAGMLKDAITDRKSTR